MLALEIELLTGRYVATAYNDRGAAEWPPHPARVFSALVAAHYAVETPDAAERAALEWLEALPPPALYASKAQLRTVSTVYVPVNDLSVVGSKSGEEAAVLDAETRLAAAEAAGQPDQEIKPLGQDLEKARERLEKRTLKLQREAEDVGRATNGAVALARQILPEHRLRKERAFPVATPDDPVVQLVWSDAEAPSEVLDALSGLLCRVTRVGHSSSLVRCSVAFVSRTPTWLPDELGTEILRVTSAGQLVRLDEAFARHRETEARVLPADFAGYRPAVGRQRERASEPLLSGDWIVFRRSGGTSPITTLTVELTEALRGALLKHAEEPTHTCLTGHGQDGGALRSPHVAFVALPNVGHAHADGRVLGVAAVMPRDLEEAGRRAVLRAIGNWEKAEGGPLAELRLLLGRAGEMHIRRTTGAPSMRTLDPDAWRAAARTWVTATPIALDRHPGSLFSRNARKAEAAEREAVEGIALACQHAGLPAPTQVTLMRNRVLLGARVAKAFGPFPRDDSGSHRRRMLVHATISFDEPVRGPVLLGAGRYRGLGLCRPLWGAQA